MGGLFPQFRLNSDKDFVVAESGVRSMAAAQMAIDRVNDKSDGVYDNLLPNTQVCAVLYRYSLFGCDLLQFLAARHLLSRLCEA